MIVQFIDIMNLGICIRWFQLKNSIFDFVDYKYSILKERLMLFPNKIKNWKPDQKSVITNSGLHYFSRKKAAVSSLEWQFPHDDYKPRERPAAACTSHGSGLSALTGSGVGLHVAASGHRPTVGPNTKNPPKMRFEIDGSYWCLQF